MAANGTPAQAHVLMSPTSGCDNAQHIPEIAADICANEFWRYQKLPNAAVVTLGSDSVYAACCKCPVVYCLQPGCLFRASRSLTYERVYLCDTGSLRIYHCVEGPPGIIDDLHRNA